MGADGDHLEGGPTIAQARQRIPETEIKALYARSGNQCAFPNCKQDLVVRTRDGEASIGEMAHMIAKADSGPRSDPSLPPELRDKAENLILLCPTHHALIDRNPCQFGVEVLREMKRIHEAVVATRLGGPAIVALPSREETVYLSALPVSSMPDTVFSAPTPYRHETASELFRALPTPQQRGVNCAFELHDKSIYTFDDLTSTETPLQGVFDPAGIRRTAARELNETASGKRLYVSLLNRSLTDYLRKMRVEYDRLHRRYYFAADRPSGTRRFTYKSVSGKKVTRSVVRNPVTRVTAKAKSYWVHLAAKLTFHQVASLQWIFTIRPERHLTIDGTRPYESRLIGAKVTRMKSTVYNWQYLQELQLWREFICQASARMIIRFSKQSLTIENRLIPASVDWPGVPEPERDFAASSREEDLFSVTQVESAPVCEQPGTDLDEHLFIYREDETSAK